MCSRISWANFLAQLIARLPYRFGDQGMDFQCLPSFGLADELPNFNKDLAKRNRRLAAKLKEKGQLLIQPAK
jgi:hypothetical protein